jgi:small GTP-binding protein
LSEKKHICVAVLAHVDAGKTTLSEAMLYLSGSIRKQGRVDNGDAFLDNYALERARGITIFSKQAEFVKGDMEITLLDTPGHVDFSAEMERTLQVLDYAILVVSGADGVQSHTKTLWRLLKRYHIPVFLFVNKMDQPGTDRERLLCELQAELDGGCVDFTGTEEETFCDDGFYENVAVCKEEVLEYFLSQGTVEKEQIIQLIRERRLFPCFFGSALKLEGVENFLAGFAAYTKATEYPAEFGAKVFKIARDAQGKRLTYLKVTGGTLRVKDLLGEEKVNQLRIYSGEKFESVDEVKAGRVCAALGLAETYPGQGFGCESAAELPVLEPVLNYRLLLPEEIDPAAFLPKLRQIEEEEPQLHILWKEETREIQVQMMGEVQIEILKSMIAERFGVSVEFGTGHIVYKETIANTVEGVGHFEPLRHYAEVHLLLEPGERGSGLSFASDCSTDVLSLNWQRLILTHLAEREHIGVLTGSVITDMKITLKSGRAHIKHTEGGDFRQATYRAVRQGLMQAENILLEPYYSFCMEVPEDAVGRAMTDIDRMHGTCAYDGVHTLTGRAPVAKLQNYQKELTTYTRGLGKLTCALEGYYPCHNTAEVIEASGYVAEADVANPSASVFCAHGAGFLVEWDEVPNYMHLESCLAPDSAWVPEKTQPQSRRGENGDEEIWMGTEEVDRIIERTYHANKKGSGEPSRNNWKLNGRSRKAAEASPVTRSYAPKQPQEEYLLVDGYNIIFAWEELKSLAAVNIDSARGRLLDILSNYQGIRGCHLIVVFDAYRVEGHKTELFDYHNIHVVYTKEAETADQYIEKFAHENGRKYRVTVATSDGLEQIIIRGAGCLLISAREFEQEVAESSKQITEEFHRQKEKGKSYLLDGVDTEVLSQLAKEKSKAGD